MSEGQEENRRKFLRKTVAGSLMAAGMAGKAEESEAQPPEEDPTQKLREEFQDDFHFLTLQTEAPRHPIMLLMEQPEAGDVEKQRQLYRLLRSLAKQGCRSVVTAYSPLPELEGKVRAKLSVLRQADAVGRQRLVNDYIYGLLQAAESGEEYKRMFGKTLPEDAAQAAQIQTFLRYLTKIQADKEEPTLAELRQQLKDDAHLKEDNLLLRLGALMKLVAEGSVKAVTYDEIRALPVLERAYAQAKAQAERDPKNRAAYLRFTRLKETLDRTRQQLPSAVVSKIHWRARRRRQEGKKDAPAGERLIPILGLPVTGRDWWEAMEDTAPPKAEVRPGEITRAGIGVVQVLRIPK